jgi:hypothetical protein
MKPKVTSRTSWFFNLLRETVTDIDKHCLDSFLTKLQNIGKNLISGDPTITIRLFLPFWKENFRKD